MQKDIQFTADVFPLGIGRYMQHIRGIDQFFADAQAGTLPAFSIVDPDFSAYSEENPQDIRRGESFAAEVIDAVMPGKGWPRTLLIWVYDEHGGYYDHVPPPPAVPPDDVAGPQPGRQPDRPRQAAAAGAAPAGGGQGGHDHRTGPLRPVRLPGAGRHRVPVRPPGLRLLARSSTTPPCSGWSRRSGTCPR